MSPPEFRAEGDNEIRQLETIVLTQVRDSMALINSNMSKMTDKMELLNDNMTRLNAQDFSAQIKRMDDDSRGETDKLWAAHSKHEDRLTAQAVQLARYGLGMAISASIGSLALGAIVVVVVTKIFGAH